MRSLLDILQACNLPAETPTRERESVESPTASDPQPVPEPRAPLFKPYTAAHREWTFAADADGQRLDKLWHVVRAAGGEGCIADIPHFLPFVRALRCACELGVRAAEGEHHIKGDSRSPCSTFPSTAVTVVTPACTSDTRGIPAPVVRWLMEAVFSVSIYSCGEKVEALADSSAGVRCPSYEISTPCWTEVLPSEAWHDSCVETAQEGSEVIRKAGDARRDGGADLMERRRVCLVELLWALAAACRFPHTREEFARQSRVKVGGLARRLSSLCDALRQKILELKRSMGGKSRRWSDPKNAGPDRFRRELIFFVRCLTPLVRIVTKSGPAGSTWGNMMENKPQDGTCLTSFLETDVDTCEVKSISSCELYTEGGDEGREGFVSVSSVADMDEWSAMLISGGLVRSLVGVLQALVDARIVVREAGLTPSTWRAWANSEAVKLAGRAVVGKSASPHEAGEDSFLVFDYFSCFECKLEMLQVEVTVALGTLLSAHPLAARDRFQLAGGALRFYHLISLPKVERDKAHACRLPDESMPGATVAAVSPFLRERGLLLALRVMHLNLRGDGTAALIPTEVVNGAALLVRAVLPAMRSVWETKGVGFGPEGVRGKEPTLGDSPLTAYAKIFAGWSTRYRPAPPESYESDRGSALSRELMGLYFPGEVAVPRLEKATFRAGLAGGSGDGYSTVRDTSSAQSVHDAYKSAYAADTPSYLLCGRRGRSVPLRQASSLGVAGWIEDGLQTIARKRGPGVATAVAFLGSRVAVALEDNDIIQVAHSYSQSLHCKPSATGDSVGNGDCGGDSFPVGAQSSKSRVLMLLAFRDVALGMICDCERAEYAGLLEEARTARGKTADAAGSAVMPGVYRTMMRSVMVCFKELLVESEGSGGVDPDVADDPILTLVSLSFFVQAVKRWPRHSIKMLREVGVWSTLFSERVLTRASRVVIRALVAARPDVDPVSGAAAFLGDSHLNGASDVEVGWGLVHDLSLLLLESSVVAGHVLQTESPITTRAANPRQHQHQRVKSGECFDAAAFPENLEEMQEFLRFLTWGGDGLSHYLSAIQGCMLLRAIIATESSGCGALLTPPLRVSALCLAFHLCDRANGAKSDAITLKELAWRQAHASVLLVLDLVSSKEGEDQRLLFQATLSFPSSLGAQGDSVQVALSAASAAATTRGHKMTASIMSDGEACTNASADSSPRLSPRNSSRGAPMQSYHDRSRSIPEILFEAAVDPLVRRAVLHLATELGAQACETYVTPKICCDCYSAAREGREKSAEVLSGLVEGYLHLCERAAAELSPEQLGLDLLQDALLGACALMRCGKRPTCWECSDWRWSQSGGVVVTAPGCSRAPDLRVSSLQEVFREHEAFARLLDVLENIVSDALDPSISLQMSSAVTPDTCSDVVLVCLSLFTGLMAGNSLGKNALRKALAEHSDRKVMSMSASSGVGKWADEGSFLALADLTKPVPATALAEALIEMMMDGEHPSFDFDKTEASGYRLRNSIGASAANDDRANREAERMGVTSPPEIRNPLVVPLIFRLLPDWPTAVQFRTMASFRRLLGGSGGGVINRSVCCDVKPALMDQLLDMLPRLERGEDGDDGLQGLAIDLLRYLGSHSITVAQLKSIFRLLQPIPASPEEHVAKTRRPTVRRRKTLSGGKVSLGTPGTPLQPPWMCALLRALRGMMDDQPGPQRLFVLDGVSSGLRLPRMPRWPAPKGYTFCTWVRLEVPPQNSTPPVVKGVGDAHASSSPASIGAPCLFIFAGERGQGVATCFIPLRKQLGHGYGRDNSASQVAGAGPAATATPPRQQYALEMRVWAGRKKAPVCIRFPSAVVTAGEWTFVAVTHAPRSWGQRGEASTLLGGCWRSAASPFPRFGDGGVVAASVGCHSRIPTNRDSTADEDGAGAKIAGRPALSCLQGQMGPIYLFAGCLPEALLRGIRELGPDYAFIFEPPQVDSREVAVIPRKDPDLKALSQLEAGGDDEKRGRVGSVRQRRKDSPENLHDKALDGTLTPLIILAYNPSLWGGEYFLDNTPETNPVRWAISENSVEARIKSFSDGTVRDTMFHPNTGSCCQQSGGGVSGGCRGSSDRRPNVGARTRGWSGTSCSSGEGSIFLEGEVGRKVRPQPRPGRMHAMRLPGTRECVRRDVRDALDCLGGVKVLLPLFAQYDHGVKRGGSAEGRSRVSYETDPRLNETVLALLAGTLRDSVPNRRFLRDHDGLSLIQHCLERVSPQHMTPGALTQACRLADRLGSWSEDWADSAISCLLVPSRLWVFASPEAQVTLAGVLRGLARECPGRMRRVVGVQRCLDALDLYFWYTPPSSSGAVDAADSIADGESQSRSPPGDDMDPETKGCSKGSRGGGTNVLRWSYVSRQWLHPLTGDVLGVKATGVDLREIRARLLDAVILMACEGDGIGTADVAAALGFLRGCRDDPSRCEALRLILRMVDDPHQADRFAVASGYVSVETGDVGGAASGGDGKEASRGLGKGSVAVGLFLSLLEMVDPTVRLLSFLALAQVLIACLRLDERSNCARGDGASGQGLKHGRPSMPGGDCDDNSFIATDAGRENSNTSAKASGTQQNTAVVEFMGGADAKAEELVVLTGASVSRQDQQSLSLETGKDRGGAGVSSGGNGTEQLELRDHVWHHIGLPRHRITGILSWAQKHAMGTEKSAALTLTKSPSDGDQRQENRESTEEKLHPGEEAAMVRTVARVTMGVLQGLLFGGLPKGFAASVVDSSDSFARASPCEFPHPFPSPMDVSLDPFFVDTRGGGEGNPGANRAGSSGSNAPQQTRTRSRSGHNSRASSRNSGSAGSLPLPLMIRLPEAFPALCQQVATAPQGAVPREVVMEVLVAASQDRRNARLILSVDCWQQYLLSVVSSAQGRQAVAASAARSETSPIDDGDVGWRDSRGAAADAAEEERLVDQTVRLICWLVMCQACEGRPGRPGAGFAAIADTMSFLRCQAELGMMECVSVGESILRHLVDLLKREMDCLESEINGWARVPQQRHLLSVLGSSGSQHSAAATLACAWPLAALVVEFIAIPPVPNPPAASAVKAPTPAAAACAVVAAAVAHDDTILRTRSSGDLLACPFPVQGLLQWLETGMRLPLPPSPPPHREAWTPRPTATKSKDFAREESARVSPDANHPTAAGSRVWDLLDAAVSLVGPTGDTLLWDVRYRHGLWTETGMTDASGRRTTLGGVVDPASAGVLDWGRRPFVASGRRDDTRSSVDIGKSGGGRGSGVSISVSNSGIGGGVGAGGGGDRGIHGTRGMLFIDAKGKENPLADAGEVPWVLVRFLLAIFVSGGAASESNTDDRSASSDIQRGVSVSSTGSGRILGNGVGKGKGAGAGPPSVALVALQHLIALMNSLESSRYEHFEFEVLHVAARVSTALRTTRLMPMSAWVLGALQLLAKCLAVHADHIEDLLVDAEDRLEARDAAKWTGSDGLPAPDRSGVESPRPRARLVFRRRLKPAGWWWLWGILSGGGGGKLSRRRNIPKGVLHQIAAETPSLATMRSSDLALEVIRRTLGIEPPGPRDGADGVSETGVEVAAPLTWDLMEAAFEPVSEKGACEEAVGLATRLDREGAHSHALDVLTRVRALERRGLEADGRVPSEVNILSSAVQCMEARRVLSVAEAQDRATLRRQGQWEAILKQLAAERGPWGRGVESADFDSVYWTLTPGEDDLGRRLKLVQNPHGSRHTIASERTRGVTRPNVQMARTQARSSMNWKAKSGDLKDPLGQNVAEELEKLGSRLDERRDVRAISAQTSLWRDLCKYQFKSYKAASSDDGVEDEDEEEEEEEDDDWGDSDGQLSGAASDDGDGGWDGSRRGGRTSEPSGRAHDSTTLFSSQADVVRPYIKTSGNISLIGHRLIFSRISDSSAAEGGVEGSKDISATVTDNYRWALRPMPNFSWPTSALRRVLFRPYGGMRFSALEMWFRGGDVDDEHRVEGTLLLGLPNDSLAKALHKALRRTRPPALEPFLGRLPVTVLSRSKAGTWGASGAGGVGMFGPKVGSMSGVGGYGSAAEAARTPLTEAWLRRRCGVTNFDYLRGLNAAAGRTTADLSRYPVFPWVLSERAWKAEELDLTDARNFRDLAWPVGAQRPEQREALHLRYQELEHMYQEQQKMGGDMAMMAIPPFHHGTLYSSSAFVLWYLMRVEPFTSLHIHLQDGRFDKADRLFSSLPEAYHSATRNPSDVKEAIPELYYLPEILVNGTGLDLGRPQFTEKPLEDVELPPWAHGDPWEFVRRHREALESEHVSLRLHRWIDLVFGCRQRPPALNGGRRGAVESCNVFFHLTYPGAVDLPRLREQNPPLYTASMKQIEEFGQAPEQLFRSPHPPRLSLARAEVVRPLVSPVPGAATTKETRSRSGPTSSPVSQAVPDGGSRFPFGVVSYPRERISRGAVLFIADLLPWAERLVSVDSRRAIGYHGWRVLTPEQSPPFRLRPDAIEAVLREEESGSGWAGGGGTGAGGGGRVRRLGVPFAPGGMVVSRILEPPSYGARWEYDYSDDTGGGPPVPCLGGGSGVGLGPHLFAIHGESRLVFSGGHWDSSFRATDLDSGRLVVSIARHRDVVTSLSLADGGSGCRRLVTASRDTTLMMWKVDLHRNPPISESSLLHVLYGHDTPVTCVCANPTLDTVVSSGEDGTVVVHTLWDGRYVRTITPRRAVPRSNAFDEERERIEDSAGSIFRQREKKFDGESDVRAGGEDKGAGASVLSKDRLPPPWPTVEWVGVSAAGYVVAYSSADATLRSYTVNGHALGVTRVNNEPGPLRAFVFSEDGTVLLSGGHDRAVTLRWAHSLALADDGGRVGYGPAVLDGAAPPLPRVSAGVKRFESAVRCMALTADERHLLVGLEDGTLGVMALDANYLRQRLRNKLDRLGI